MRAKQALHAHGCPITALTGVSGIDNEPMERQTFRSKHQASSLEALCMGRLCGRWWMGGAPTLATVIWHEAS